MSLTTDITNLTAQVTQLIQTVDQQDDVVQDKISQLAAMVPNTSRVLYVNANSGDDANDGLDPTSPLATLEEALARAPIGGRLVVRLLTNVSMTKRVQMLASRTSIMGWDAAAEAQTKRQFTVVGTQAVNRTDGWMPGLGHHMFGALWFENVNFRLPLCDETVTGLRAIVNHHRGGTTVFRDCIISAAEAGADSYAFAAGNGIAIVSMSNTTINNAVGPGTGRLFSGIAAGADPNGQWNIITNITQN